MSVNEVKKGNALALLPLIIFVALFIGAAVLTKDFSNMPLNVALIIASAFALLMNRKEKFEKKIEIFTKGAGHANIILMAVIFILAGAFATVAKGMGAVDSTVNLGLSLLPANLLMVGLFIIGCFISISMGTSMGTVVALAPIAIGIASQTDIPAALALATVIGGAMFGDNLSMISDTTIAAVRTQQTKMKDKFKVNFFIVLPGAILTSIILGVITRGNTALVTPEHQYNLLKVLPYLAVLAAALAGVHVLIVLIGGTIFAGAIGLVDGSYSFGSFLATVSEGIIGMEDLAIIALLIGGLVAIIRHNGGIDYLLYTVTSKLKTKKGAEFGIAGLVSAVALATANNTISIIITGPLAKSIADEYDIDPRKSASLLDTFSSSWQGILPYGGQMLAAAGLASISPLTIMPYSFYPILMGGCAIIAILIGYPKLQSKTAKQVATVPAD
ncbi:MULTISPECIES: Na+/H+ antiporter NhaC family protein [unclassified Sporosarcina]|uniref:Na+/H+ antiporter NhaC family protein n=1 Tax=unclassified Sporosarcina TaxID=2647733 RepID=UPI0020422A68|nr:MULTISPECIES: Na+/H+ antiporter NhaC family protein [unclassified Sporosarcina]GKV66158.1 sodium:proton antiporter [Sporosarcina sp. NCCP-2331]GLB56234.1 sodium:proton antiporter [Sporosarcina sp. NCCP-2378]